MTLQAPQHLIDARDKRTDALREWAEQQIAQRLWDLQEYLPGRTLKFVDIMGAVDVHVDGKHHHDQTNDEHVREVCRDICDDAAAFGDDYGITFETVYPAQLKDATEPQTYEAFAKAHNVTLTATGHDMRTDRIGACDDWDKTALHYNVVLSVDGRAIWSGWYSMGFGHAETWARKHKNHKHIRANIQPNGHVYASDVIGFLKNPLPCGKRHADDSVYCRTIRTAALKHMKPEPADVLLSLALDASGSDQDFEEWATDLGYDPDSRKGYAIWEACNATRRALQNGLGSELFAEFQECEE